MTDFRHWKAQESLTDRIARVGWTVAESGCWEWNGFIEPRGYAKVMHGGKSHRVHRVMLAAEQPMVPGKPMACHTCDNRRCINPQHLYWGSHADNTADARDRGRLKGRTKQISLDDRTKIRELRATGKYTYKQLGERFGVTAVTAHRIVNYETATAGTFD